MNDEKEKYEKVKTTQKHKPLNLKSLHKCLVLPTFKGLYEKEILLHNELVMYMYIAIKSIIKSFAMISQVIAKTT